MTLSLLQTAIAENQLGHFDAAIAHAEAAIRLRQDGCSPYLCAAYAAARLHGEERALEWVEQGLALHPDDCLALSARANLLRGLHRAEAALESCERWAKLEPLNGAAQLCCAQVYQDLHLNEQAVAAYTKAAERALRPAAVLTDLSILLFELGRRDEALRTLDRAFAADGNHAAAWYTLAEAKLFTPADPDIELMQRQLQLRATEPPADALHDTMLLHYALAKAHADFDDYSQALVHLNAGSRLKRGTLNYDPAADERFMAEMAHALGATSIERLRGAGVETSMPIFIVGMPRSGTSLLEQVLASHPNVFGAGESARIQSLVAEFGDRYPACLDSITRERVGAMADRYLKMLPAHGAAHVTDKTPYNYLHLGLIHAMFPDARIIHCMRDPADTCVSVYSKLFSRGNEFSYDIRELCRYYRGYVQLMGHWRSVIPADRLLDVEYEKFVQGLEGEARRVMDFCGLPWTDACLRFHETQRVVRTASLHQVREPLYRSSVGRAQRFGGLGSAVRAALGASSR